MEITWIWTGMVTLSLLFGIATGNLDAVANGALEGARSAIELSLSMAGILCLWSGVMEVMNACGISAGLARLFRPILRRLLPDACRDEEALAAVSATVSANLLCLLVVLNTASIQLLPATIASVRAAAGCQTPFDILPAVWMASAMSVTAGLLAAWLLSHRRAGR